MSEPFDAKKMALEAIPHRVTCDDDECQCPQAVYAARAGAAKALRAAYAQALRDAKAIAEQRQGNSPGLIPETPMQYVAGFEHGYDLAATVIKHLIAAKLKEVGHG